MSVLKFSIIGSAVLVVVTALWSHPVYAVDWQDLWSTPEQRAKKQLAGERYDELIEQAPDAGWRGIGEYRSGDYESAAESFSQQRETAEVAGSVEQIEQTIYNEANAHTLNENYSEAIDLFNEILASNPTHNGADHNRAIAEQLQALQKQEQQQQQNSENQQSEDQESGEKGDDQSSDDQQESDQQQGEEGEDQQESDQQSDDKQNAQNSQSAEDGSEQSSESEEQQDQAEQDAQAAAAMAAEKAKAEQTGDQTDQQDGAEGSLAPRDPLTEKEQANEQWLRQIPDDPAGLLQRKLQNRHLTDFPKVKDSVEPW